MVLPFVEERASYSVVLRSEGKHGTIRKWLGALSPRKGSVPALSLRPTLWWIPDIMEPERTKEKSQQEK